MSRAPGQAWEGSVLDECAWLANRGTARAQRTKPPINHLGMAADWAERALGIKVPDALKGKLKGLFVATYTGEVSVDFEGSVRGQRVVFDAKSSQAEPSWPFSDIRDGQIEHMAAGARCGELAFFYVERRGATGRPRYIVPVDAQGRIAGVSHKRDLVGPLLRRDARESVRWEDLEMWRCQPGELWADAVARMRPMWPGNKEGA